MGNKRNGLEKNDNTVPYKYWLAFRSGTTEWSARIAVSKEVLSTLEHGKTYTSQELKVLPILGIPSKIQFIVEEIKWYLVKESNFRNLRVKQTFYH